MKINDIPTNLLEPGIRVKSFKDPSRYGTLVEIEGKEENPTCSFQWDTEREATFFCKASSCDLEIVELFELTIDGKTVPVINCWWVDKDFYVHDFDNKVIIYHNAWFEHGSQNVDVEASITIMELNYEPVKGVHDKFF